MFFVYDLLGIGNQNLSVGRYSWASVGSTHLARAVPHWLPQFTTQQQIQLCFFFLSGPKSQIPNSNTVLPHFFLNLRLRLPSFIINKLKSSLFNHWKPHTPNPNIPLSHPFLILSHIQALLFQPFPFFVRVPFWFSVFGYIKLSLY